MAVDRVYLTEVVMESAGAELAAAAFAVCADNTFGTAQIQGCEMATFEFDFASAGYTAGTPVQSFINIYERKINSDGNACGIAPSATYKFDYIGSFIVPGTDAQHYLSTDCPIHPQGATFSVEFEAGVGHTGSIEANWILRVIPFQYSDV